MAQRFLAIGCVASCFLLTFFPVAGMGKAAPGNQNSLPESSKKGSFHISSPAFQNNAPIPSKYTCEGKNVNPPIAFEDVPQHTGSLVLIMDDPDAPMGTWTHWVLWNIDPSVRNIPESALPKGAEAGQTSFKTTAYGGPCPPSNIHRYFFKVYALDEKLTLPAGSDRKKLEAAIKGHIIGQAVLMGRYEKQYR